MGSGRGLYHPLQTVCSRCTSVPTVTSPRAPRSQWWTSRASAWPCTIHIVLVARSVTVGASLQQRTSATTPPPPPPPVVLLPGLATRSLTIYLLVYRCNPYNTFAASSSPDPGTPAWPLAPRVPMDRGHVPEHTRRFIDSVAIRRGGGGPCRWAQLTDTIMGWGGAPTRCVASLGRSAALPTTSTLVALLSAGRSASAARVVVVAARMGRAAGARAARRSAAGVGATAARADTDMAAVDDMARAPVVACTSTETSARPAVADKINIFSQSRSDSDTRSLTWGIPGEGFQFGSDS
jgi:hypothetical protein